MSSRKERTAKLKAKRKSVLITTATIVAVVISTLIAISFIGTRDITDIEDRIPADAGIVFISNPNEASWKYFNALAGSKTMLPEEVEKIGYANINRTSTLYFSVNKNNIESTDSFLEENSIPYVKNDTVYALSVDSGKLSENGIGKNSEYHAVSSKGSNSSFGYISFPKIDSEELPEDIDYMLPSAGLWSGEFKGGKWDGKVKDVDYSKIDEAKSTDSLIENVPLGYFMDDIEYKKGQSIVKGSFETGEVNSLLNNGYQTFIQTVDFEINGDRLTFILK